MKWIALRAHTQLLRAGHADSIPPALAEKRLENV
jgi:hypothetical protein